MFKRLKPRKSASRWLGAGETELELDKHFSVVKKLGQGSYATVYQVRRHEDGQMYALKVADVKALGPLEQADAVNEIRLLASLSHPNLTTFYEAFCDHGKLCIVQELVDGGDVATLVRRRAAAGTHFTEDQVWATFLQVALALQYMHHNHILHRDLKPRNLLVAETGVVKVADLGISQILDRVFTHALIGTPHYMAPEMWHRQPYSYSADVWALGCVLYELCALKPLFLAETEAAIRIKVLGGVVPPLPARYSLELQDLVEWMLQPHPADRPTLDDILQHPAAQRHLSLLPPELQLRCISTALGSEHDLVRLMQPIAVPKGSEDWELLNEMMPTPRYPSDTSVSGALKKAKNWKSTGDLQALAAVSAGATSAGAPSAARLDSSSRGRLRRPLGEAAPPLPPAAQAAAAMRKSSSHGDVALLGGSTAASRAGSLSAAAEARIERSHSSLTRRRSAAVGELLLRSPRGSPSPTTSVDGGGGGGGMLGMAPLPLHRELRLASVAEERGRGWGAGGAGTSAPQQAQQAQQEAASEGRVPGSVRSRSLSVEDAVEVLARGAPLPELPRRPTQRDAQHAQQEMPPLTDPPAESLATAQPGSGAGQAGPSGRAQAHQAPLPGPAVPAQAQAQAAQGIPALGSTVEELHAQAELQQGLESIQQRQQQGQLEAQPAHGQEAPGKKSKKKGFWKVLAGGGARHK